MNTYECMLLLDNREVREGWQALKERVAGMLTKHGAEVLSARRWEERRLAYAINHQQRGTYLLVYFKSGPEAIAPMRREMELSETVMRNLVLTCEQVPEDAYQPEDEFDESQVQVEDIYQAPARPAAEEKSEEGEEGEAEGGKSAEGESDAKSADGEAAEASAADKPEEGKGEPVAATEPAGDAGGDDSKETKE